MMPKVKHENPTISPETIRLEVGIHRVKELEKCSSPRTYASTKKNQLSLDEFAIAFAPSLRLVGLKGKAVVNAEASRL